MLVHNVKFYDTNHLHDSLGQDSADEKREFHGKGKDVLRQKIMSSDTQYTQEAYN